MSNILYFLGGILALAIGIFITISQIKTFIKKQQDELGFDIGLLGGGLCSLFLGICLIEHFWPLLF